MRLKYKQSSGFTIVELLIVVVVIGILAAITIVAYNGVQTRSRDSQRDTDLANIQKALELYYADNGTYPSGGGSTSINGSWSTTADSSWPNLANTVAPNYVSAFPRDPISKQTSVGAFPWNDAAGYDYSYVALSSPSCGLSGTRQGYLIVYKYESKTNVNTNAANCTATTVGPYSNASNLYKLNK